VFNSIQVTNYWFTLHRALGPLYQQAQTSSPNIRGISDQDVTSFLIEYVSTDSHMTSSAATTTTTTIIMKCHTSMCL